MARCEIKRNQLFAELRDVNEAAIKAAIAKGMSEEKARKEVRATMDVFVAHMQSKTNLYPLALEEGDTPIDYWKGKVTAFRGETSALIKEHKAKGRDDLAKHYTEGLAITKLGAAPKVKTEDQWADILTMIQAAKNPPVVTTPTGDNPAS